MVKDLNADLKEIESDRLFCMIYETYQNFFTHVRRKLGNNTTSGEEKTSSIAGIGDWIANFEASDQFKVKLITHCDYINEF